MTSARGEVREGERGKSDMVLDTPTSRVATPRLHISECMPYSPPRILSGYNTNHMTSHDNHMIVM